MIDRRTFFALFLTPRMMLLEAIAAARMPETILVPGTRIRGPVFESRSYASPIRTRVLQRAGITAIRRGGNSYWFPFVSLESRQRAWDAVAADPEWRGMHATEISIYRRIA